MFGIHQIKRRSLFKLRLKYSLSGKQWIKGGSKRGHWEPFFGVKKKKNKKRKEITEGGKAGRVNKTNPTPRLSYKDLDPPLSSKHRFCRLPSPNPNEARTKSLAHRIHRFRGLPFALLTEFFCPRWEPVCRLRVSNA